MSQTVCLSGQDTFKMDGRIFNDLADGDAVVADFPNDIAGLKTGKNGNSLYALNETGKQMDLAIRVVRGSSDDKYLSSRIAAQLNNFAGFVLANAEFTKRLGDGLGNILSDTYISAGGIFTKQVPAKSNVEGDTAQAVAEYHLKFSNAPRTLS